MTVALPELTASDATALLRAMVGRRVVVIGDGMLDGYLTGRIGRISPEAPVPVFNVEHETFMLGGAANVAKCLVALGARVGLCAVVGDDANADVLTDEASNLGIDAAGLVRDPSRPTTRKTRVVAQNQQMIRLDREELRELSDAVERKLIRKIERAVARADAVVLSDYAKGALTKPVCRAAIKAAKGKPVVVDPKELPWDRYAGATMIKPNRREAGWFVGRDVRGDEAVAQAARSMSQKLRCPHVLITRSESGMTLRTTPPSGRKKTLHVRPIRREVFDPTGAGDVVAATLALALAAGADAAAAAVLANVAGAIEVSKFGTAVVTDSEIIEALGGDSAGHGRKIMSRAAAAAFAADLRRQGKRVVFTNGCFDILHVGHVQYLEDSSRRGEALVVGINTDASVRRLKGAGRPVQPEADRARIIAAQACVDAVVLFDEDTPIELIKAVKPDVLTKGADYQKKQNVVGWDLVERWGGRVELIQLVQGRSTTQLIRKANR